MDTSPVGLARWIGDDLPGVMIKYCIRCWRIWRASQRAERLAWGAPVVVVVAISMQVTVYQRWRMHTLLGDWLVSAVAGAALLSLLPP
jgi:hypothetical protein